MNMQKQNLVRYDAFDFEVIYSYKVTWLYVAESIWPGKKGHKQEERADW